MNQSFGKANLVIHMASCFPHVKRKVMSKAVISIDIVESVLMQIRSLFQVQSHSLIAIPAKVISQLVS